MKEFLEEIDKFMALVVVMISWYIVISNLKLYALNMYIFLYAYYHVSIKGFFRKKIRLEVITSSHTTRKRLNKWKINNFSHTIRELRSQGIWKVCGI